MTREEALRIYEKEVDHFNQTRSVQWRFNVATWTLLLVSTYFVKSKGIEIPVSKLYLASVFFILVYSYFIYLNQLSLKASKQIWNSILRQLNHSNEKPFIDVNISRLTKSYWTGWRGFWWTLYFTISTSILLSILIFILTTKTRCNC
jgi:hypothetical protein